MKKLTALLLASNILLSMTSCDFMKNFDDLKSTDPDIDITEKFPDTSSDRITNDTNEDGRSVLEIYRLIVESFPPAVNANPRALAFSLGILDNDEEDTFVNLYSSVHQFYPGRGEEDGASPHYRLGCGYAQKDLNGDGVDELVLMNKDYYIMAIFSYANEKPVLLGNYRPKHSCWIDGDGLLHLNSTDGADYSTNAVYKISSGSEQLELLAEFGTNGAEWIGNVAYTTYYKLLNGEKVSITKSEYTSLEQQYGKYLGSVAGAEATKQHSGLRFTPLYTEEEIAMQMYEAAIKGEICVMDELLCEVKLTDCQFPSNNSIFGRNEILYKAILDMDGDGINEYVIQSETGDHIVLHYYDGKVYSYCFDKKSFFNLNTDGSFYWIDSYELSNCTRGYNQIAFDGSSLRINELYRIKQTSPHDYGDGDHEYYVDGKQITRDEFWNYYDSNCRGAKLAIFSPLDLSCEYPISSEKACELASEFWGIKSGEEDGAAGSLYVSTIVILEKPNNDTLNYHIGLRWARYSTHVIDNLFGQPPSTERIYEEVIVDAITGECREYVDSVPDGK